jgi:glycosyltransferase involved in cell wall biosynthesis
MKIVVIIPTLNPDRNLIVLVALLKERGFSRFIIVDDGSGQNFRPIFEELSDQGCVVLHQDNNFGKGASIKLALSVLRNYFPDATGYVTVDGDGQHVPDDVLKVAHKFEQYPPTIILGMRALNKRGVPFKSRLGNAFSSLYFKFDTGVFYPDTQTGLRLVPVALIDFALNIEGKRYDYEMNFLTQAVKKGIPVDIVSIKTVYIDKNSQSHFRPLHDSFLIYQSFIRFALASLTCAILDLGLFALISSILNLDVWALVASATILARVTSAAMNFFLNRFWSFRSKGLLPQELIRYAVLFMVQMLLSMSIVSLLANLSLPLVLIKALVDSLLFVASYFIQRNWVFQNSKHYQTQYPIKTLRSTRRRSK